MAVYKQLYGKCWFCQRREADESAELLVEVRKETRTERTWNKTEVMTETREFVVPRCPQCASIKKRESRKMVVGTIGAILSAVAGGIAAAGIGGNQFSDLYPFLGCTAGLVIFLAPYFYWYSRRLERLPAEQRQDLKDAQKSFREYPEIAQATRETGKGIQFYFKTIG